MDYLVAFLEWERNGVDVEKWIEWTGQHAELPIFAVTIYLAFIFYVPNFISKPLAGTKGKTAFAIWNLILSVFSICGVYRTVPYLIDTWIEKGFKYCVCEPPSNWYLVPPTGLWVGIFVYSKFPELLDTFFLVIQKKPVIFLHWFHHTTVLLYCWHAFHHSVSSGLFFAAMNFTVHSIMYLYYFMSIIGFGKYARPLAPYITTLQLLQMVGGITVTIFSAYWHTLDPDQCFVDPANYKLGLGMYFCYFVLFGILFYNNYIVKKKHIGGDTKLCGVAVKNVDGGGFFHSQEQQGGANKRNSTNKGSQKRGSRTSKKNN